MKTNRCSHSECIAPQSACHLGQDTTTCEHWTTPVGTTAAQNRTAQEMGRTRLAWSGLPLGLQELTIVAARNKPYLVSIVGPHNAGKTTLLGMAYSHLWHGGRFGTAQFAGSFTLSGWENIAQYMRWCDDTPPHFPPHTELTEARTPGLLHLAFRQPNDKLTDWLLTDAPGEWFKRWSLDEQAPEVEGARWMAQNSSAFILVLDCEWLSGPERGGARTAYQQLINRLASARKDRPLAAVWSKADQIVDEGKFVALKQHLTRFLAPLVEFRVSVKTENGQNRPTTAELARLFSWLNENQEKKTPVLLSPAPTFAPDDALLSFRG